MKHIIEARKVRNRPQILTALFLAIVYSLTIGSVTLGYLMDVRIDQSAGRLQRYSSELSGFSLFNQIPPNQQPFLYSAGVRESNSFRPGWALKWIRRNSERFFQSRFSNYLTEVISIPYRYRKSDLIYPFQYFWWIHNPALPKLCYESTWGFLPNQVL